MIISLTISIHTLRVEGDVCNWGSRPCRFEISIHTLRVEGDCLQPFRITGFPISIHTLRVEGDGDGVPASHSGADFYPHPPCGG